MFQRHDVVGEVRGRENSGQLQRTRRLGVRPLLEMARHGWEGWRAQLPRSCRELLPAHCV